jgi:tetratricopeptide (TPR) repeat protein
MALHELGHNDAAVIQYEAAVALRPGYAIALNNFGVALAALGRYLEALPRYEAAMAVDPGYAEALNNLGAALHALGRYGEAIYRFKAALTARPGFRDAAINLAHAQLAAGRRSDAIAGYRSVLKDQPTDGAVHLFLADVLFKEHQSDQAIWHYRRACDLQPNLPGAHAGLGTVLQEVGHITEARCCFERAIALDPRQPSYYLSLVRNRRLAPNDPHVGQLLSLAEEADGLSDDGKVHLHFALGTVLPAIGRHEDGFRHLLAGNELKRRVTRYDEVQEIAALEQVREVFSTNFMRRLQGAGVASSLPVFILGMPRSGSTLVEQILASHPDVAACGELNDFHESIRAAGLHSQENPYPTLVPNCTMEQLRQIGLRYEQRLRLIASAPGKQRRPARATDKMPANARYTGLIHLALPNARIIHTRRDPIDTCLSCFSLLFEDLPFTYDLAELGRRYAANATMMQHWHDVLPSGVILDVTYEDLVMHPEIETRRILAHCGLDWDGACLRFHETSRPVRTASVVQVRQPLYQSSVRRWRPEPAVMAPLLEALGSILDED